MRCSVSSSLSSWLWFSGGNFTGDDARPESASCSRLALTDRICSMPTMPVPKEALGRRRDKSWIIDIISSSPYVVFDG